MKRRLMLSALTAAGALVVGWGMLPPRSRVGSRDMLPVADGEIGLNGWIKITPDHHVVLAMHRSEMGQGVHTALPMLVAEELSVPLEHVRLIPAGPDKLYGNIAMFVGCSLPLHPSATEPGRESLGARAGTWFVSKLARELGINATGGSSSVADAWDALRMAAATVRAQLLGAAALKWKLAVDELTITDGVISHSSGPSAPATALARAAAVLGDGASLPAVAALAERSETDTAAALAALARAEIVKDEWPLAFAHPLVRDAVYRELPAPERALLHERAAAVLRPPFVNYPVDGRADLESSRAGVDQQSAILAEQ